MFTSAQVIVCICCMLASCSASTTTESSEADTDKVAYGFDLSDVSIAENEKDEEPTTSQYDRVSSQVSVVTTSSSRSSQNQNGPLVHYLRPSESRQPAFLGEDESTEEKNESSRMPSSEIIVRSQFGVIDHLDSEVGATTQSPDSTLNQSVDTEQHSGDSTDTPPVTSATPHTLKRGRVKHTNSVYQDRGRNGRGSGRRRSHPSSKRRDEKTGSVPEKYAISYNFESKRNKAKQKDERPDSPNSVVSTASSTENPEMATIQITSYLADSDSAIDMNDMPKSELPKLGVTGADVISAFFVTAADDDHDSTESNEIGRSRVPHRFSSSSTTTPKPPALGPIVVPEHTHTLTLNLPAGDRGHILDLSPDAGEINNNGHSGFIRRGRFTTIPPSELKSDTTPAPSVEPVLVTPRQSGSLLTSSDRVLAPIQAAISLSSNAQDDEEKSSKKSEENMIEKQILHEEPVYKTFIEIQKSIPFEIKEQRPQVPTENTQDHRPPIEVTQPVVQSQPAGVYNQNFLQQVMLAYQRLSNNPKYISNIALPEPQVTYRQHPPLTQNLYYIYRNRYGIQPQQIYYYMPYTTETPSDSSINSGYIGRYIMQHSHENTGTEQTDFPKPSYPDQPIYNTLFNPNYNQQYLEQDQHPFGQKSQQQLFATGRHSMITINNHNILHDNGATSTTYFKIGSENNVEGEGNHVNPDAGIIKTDDGVTLFRNQYDSSELQEFHQSPSTYVSSIVSPAETEQNAIQLDGNGKSVDPPAPLSTESSFQNDHKVPEDADYTRVTQLYEKHTPQQYQSEKPVDRPQEYKVVDKHQATKLVKIEKHPGYPQPYQVLSPVVHYPAMSVPVPQFIPYPQILPPGPLVHDHQKRKETSEKKRVPFRPSQPVYTSQYPPQTYRVLSTMRGRIGGPHPRSIRGKKLCIEYGGFKPPLIPSVQIDDKFFEKQDAEEKTNEE